MASSSRTPAETSAGARLLEGFARVAIAGAVIVAVILVSGAVAPFEAGPAALLQLLAPHLALACLVLVPLAALARSRSLGAILGVVALAFVLRFGGEWWSSPAPSGGASTPLSLVTWNLEAGSRPGAVSAAILRSQAADLIALEELTFDTASAIDGDAVLTARYPYRVLEPSQGVSGAGLLSTFPIESSDFQLDPVRLEARVQLAGGPVVVLVAHPLPGEIRSVRGLPMDFEPTRRNADLKLLRSRVAELEALGVPVVLTGDFNTAPTDPAFGRLTAGLRDAHAASGIGPGWTWRPERLAFLGIGLLRIDLILSTGELEPRSTTISCPVAGDHCLLQGTFAIVT